MPNQLKPTIKTIHVKVFGTLCGKSLNCDTLLERRLAEHQSIRSRRKQYFSIGNQFWQIERFHYWLIWRLLCVQNVNFLCQYFLLNFTLLIKVDSIKYSRWILHLHMIWKLSWQTFKRWQPPLHFHSYRKKHICVAGGDTSRKRSFLRFSIIYNYSKSREREGEGEGKRDRWWVCQRQAFWTSFS